MYNLKLNAPVLVYLPTYNCEAFILRVLDEIPEEIWGFSEILVLDNCSTDRTVAVLTEAIAAGRFPKPIRLLKTPSNLGYSGSQKTAFKIALANPVVEWVVMLHGDGQYPPVLLPELLRAAGEGVRVVYGHRDRSSYPDKEETPFFTYVFIRLLSALESLATGYARREWHTGFVMYHREFLQQVDLDALTTTPHIDGHLLFAAGVLDAPSRGRAIYKRYREFESFGGMRRILYVFQVFWLLLKFRYGKNQIERKADLEPPEFEVVSNREPLEEGDAVKDLQGAVKAFERFLKGTHGSYVQSLVEILKRSGRFSGDLDQDLKRLEETLCALNDPGPSPKRRS